MYIKQIQFNYGYQLVYITGWPRNKVHEIPNILINCAFILLPYAFPTRKYQKLPYLYKLIVCIACKKGVFWLIQMS